MARGVVGSVSISVLPDLTKFYRELRRGLTVIERDKSLQPKISAQLDNIDVDKTRLEAVKQRIEEKFDDLKATINADVDSAAARIKLALLTRPRTIRIGTVFEDSGKVAQALGAFSGLRSLDKTVSWMRNLAMNMDLVAVKATAAYGAISALSTVALGGVAGVINFGAGLAKAGKSIIALPALLSSATVGVGTFVAALKDTETVLGDLAPQFHELQDVLSAKFWGQAEAPLRRLVSSIMPELERGFTATATAAGQFTARLADAVRESAVSGKMRVLFDQTSQAITRSATGARDMADAFINIGTVGAQYLPQLAEWVNSLAARFDTFIQTAAQNGDLARWMSQGVQGLQDMGNLVKNLASAWAGLYKAASTAGTGMAGLVEQTGKFAAMVNKASFQEGLSTILDGARKGAEGLKNGLTDVGRAIGEIAPLLADMLATAGRQIGELGTAIAGALKTDDIQAGLAGLRAGFVSFTNAIARTIENLTPTIGALLSAFGKVADTVGTTLSGALMLVQPVLTTIVNAFTALPAPLLAAAAAFVAFKKAAQMEQLAGLKNVFSNMGTYVKNLGKNFDDMRLHMMMGASGATVLKAGLTGVAGVAKTVGLSLKAAFMSNPIGIALTALTSVISYFAGKSQEAAQKQEELRNTLDQTTGAVTEQTAAWLASDEDVKSLVASYEEIGGAAEDVYAAIQGNDQAYKNFVARLREAEDAGTLTAAASSELFDALQDQRRGVEQAQLAQREANKATEAAKEGYSQQADMIQKVIDATDRLLNQQKAATDAQFAADDAQAAWVDGQQEYAQALAQSAGSWEKQKVALNDYAQKALDVMNTQRDLGVSHEALNEKARTLGDSIYQAAIQMGMSSEQARNYVAELGLIPDSALTEAKLETENALFQLGEFIIEVNNKEGTVTINSNKLPAQTTLAEFVGEANVSNGTVTLNGNKLPADLTLAEFVASVNTSSGTSSIYGNKANAEATLQQFVNKTNATGAYAKIYGKDYATSTANSIRSSIAANPAYLHIKALYDSATSKVMRGQYYQAMNRYLADGGILSRIPSVNFFAGGAENHVAQIAPAGAYRVWAESETGGEAYIPLAPHKRARSLKILNQVADEFGYQLAQKAGKKYADGGITHATTPIQGGATYNIHVNVDAQDLRDLHDMASFINMLNVYQHMGMKG